MLIKILVGLEEVKISLTTRIISNVKIQAEVDTIIV